MKGPQEGTQHSSLHERVSWCVWLCVGMLACVYVFLRQTHRKCSGPWRHWETRSTKFKAATQKHSATIVWTTQEKLIQKKSAILWEGSLHLGHLGVRYVEKMWYRKAHYVTVIQARHSWNTSNICPTMVFFNISVIYYFMPFPPWIQVDICVKFEENSL